MKKHLLIISIFFTLAPVHSVLAALLMPLDVNDLYTYNKRDSAAPPTEWIMLIQGLNTVDIEGQQYVNASTWNSHGTGDYGEGLFRSTETAVYSDDGSMEWQIAPIGTTWSFPSFRDSEGSGSIVNEIISIESVTVPYGSFDNVYVQRVYFDPDNPSLPNTDYWYEYLVQGIGLVKQVDYTWSTNVPYITELAQISSVPIPAAAWLFGSGLIGLIGLARRKAA